MRPKEILPWLPKDKRLDNFYQGIVNFVEDYVEDSTKSKKYVYSKEILDPCVGYIKINSWEMAVLDTMLFQRLRKISQLGLAYLVYPSLNYSRFEHTIGTLGRLNQVLTRLKENDIRLKEKVKKRRSDITVIDRYEIAIRIAALFHDVGHCLFSHLSEFAISDLQGNEQDYTDEDLQNDQPPPAEYYPSVKTIEKIFNREFARDKEKLKIFEIFSIAILGTKKIAKLIFDNFPEIDEHKLINIPRTLKKITDKNGLLHQSAHFIAGLPANDEPETVFLAQLMSSGLDVDKLDYMSREEHFSGIKIEMDLQRIFNKINIFPKSKSELATPLKKYSDFIKHTSSDTRNYILLGIDKGGQFAYEEFCVARLSLYEKIYLHKKVRAAESYMKKQIKGLIQNEKNYQRAHNWLYVPESIIEKKMTFSTSEMVVEDIEILGQITQMGTKKNVETHSLFSDIFKRQIPDRAFGFGPSNSKTDSPINEIAIDEEKVKELQSVRLWEFLLSQEQRQLELSVIEEAKKITEEIKDKNEYDFLPKSEEDWKNIEKTLVFDIPKPNRVKLDPQTLHFEDIGALNTVNWTIPIANIHISYLLHKILAYVYVNHRFVPLITLACERIFYKYTLNNKEEQFIFDQTQAISKENQSKIKKIKDELVAVGFYNTCPELMPLDPKLTTANAVELIENVVRNLSYLECCDSPSKLEVEEFLKQFDEDMQLSALHLISNIKVLSPQKELPDIIKEIRNSEKVRDKGVVVLPLGNYLNSSSNFYKHLKNTFNEQKITSLSFDDKDLKDEIERNDYIFLIDDNINSGIQCFNFMMRYLGYSDSVIEKDNRNKLWLKKYDNRTECTHPALEISKKLRNKKFEFIFVTGHETSKNELSHYLTKYCKLEQDNFEITIIHEIKNNDKIFDLSNLTYSKIDDKNYTIFGKLKMDFRTSVTPEQIDKISNKFREIGKQVVKQKGVCRDCEQPEEDHALGYHNRENLIVFVNSIPTMTFTALWCEGKYTDKNGDVKIWKPLIKRK
ncbi:MAG: hypothetical protein LBE36_13135 [Flavobacteriaceae bacterium]|jgi:HD superfamily phosphohydrolase|nr:hypothetical protein [Flavobacteriaceae bacterium]